MAVQGVCCPVGIELELLEAGAGHSLGSGHRPTAWGLDLPCCPEDNTPCGKEGARASASSAQRAGAVQDGIIRPALRSGRWWHIS